MSDKDKTMDIVDRLRAHAVTKMRHGTGGEPVQTELGQLLEEAASNIEFLRKQSRGHFEAMTAVLRDGIEALDPSNTPNKPN